MATTLYLLDTVADTHLGADNANTTASPANVGWTSRALGTARGSGVVASDSVATVTFATTGGPVVTKGSSAVEWISPPVAADVTISGTLTANIWAAESNMSANVVMGVSLSIIRANATATRNSNTIADIVGVSAAWSHSSELAVTTRAVNNFLKGAYGSHTVNRGDRIRIVLYGGAIGSQAATFTFNVGYNGATASADGDSYVTLTENVTFEGPLIQSIATSSEFFGAATAAQQFAQPFVAQSALLTGVIAYLSNDSTAPADDFVVEIQTDSAGSPSGSVVGTVGSMAGSALSGSVATARPFTCSIALTASTTYWLVYRRSGSLSDTNLYRAATTSAGTVPSGWTTRKTYTGSWGTPDSRVATVSLTFGGTVLYLTDTASAVSTASVDREAWTSRGAGVQTDVRNTAAGWTTPLQLTDTAGGTVVDWFTKQLAAFTLTGMAVANIRAASSSASANDSIRCEIARVNSDGTSPTVWASWCIAPTGTDNGELATSEVARTAKVSGDDLAFTDGQRIRIRLYTDDMSAAAMAASFTTTVYYAGTSGGASGDTYITLPQTVTEYVPASLASPIPTRYPAPHMLIR